MLNKHIAQKLSGLIGNGSNEQILKEIQKLKQTDEVLSNKILDILIHLDLTNESDISEIGHWFDSLTSDKNISSISELKLDTERTRILGSNGYVIFNSIDIPFDCDKVRYIHELDDNFVESIVQSTIESGTTVLNLEKYSYEIK